MKLSRLSGRKVNEHVMKKGEKWNGKTINIRFLSGAPKGPNYNPAENALYVGTFAPLKLHKSAVKRNRMRRRCREALRRTVRDIKKIPTMQLLISPRSSSLECDFADIESDVCEFISTVSKNARGT